MEWMGSTLKRGYNLMIAHHLPLKIALWNDFEIQKHIHL